MQAGWAKLKVNFFLEQLQKDRALTSLDLSMSRSLADILRHHGRETSWKILAFNNLLRGPERCSRNSNGEHCFVRQVSIQQCSRHMCTASSRHVRAL